ncbi:MAG: hypothetical protein IT386_04960 [Deltaproteobacteria bacterium]|nr:hypothetical protein [Deltaproteobacteria bacterium]
MSAAAGKPLDRATVWRRLGEPTDQVGSVNDPRTGTEYGVRWNEKWIYRATEGETIERVVLWHRYDFQGAFRISADGSPEPEVLPEA